MARRFAQVLRRQISLNHLCQAARSVVHNPEISAQMLEDWISVDLNSIIKQTLYSMGRYRAKVTDTIVDRTVNLLSSLNSLYVSKSIKTFTQKNYLQMDSLCLQPTCPFCFCFVFDLKKKLCNFYFVFIVCGEFEQLLEDQAPLQSYVEWMDNMVDRCVVQVS